MRYELHGSRFGTREELFEEVRRVLVPGLPWGHDPHAFNAILRGGTGTPSTGITIGWKNHTLSKERLAYGQTIPQLELRLQNGNAVYRPLGPVRGRA